MPAAWHSKQLTRGVMGCGTYGGWAEAGADGAAIICRICGAFRPAYFQAVPWQALFEQKLLLSLPPGFSIVWHAEQVWSNCARCCDSQVVLLCESGSF